MRGRTFTACLLLVLGLGVPAWAQDSAAVTVIYDQSGNGNDLGAIEFAEAVPVSPTLFDGGASGGAGASAEFTTVGVLGTGVPKGSTTLAAPCDVVGGCIAAYSAQRLMLASYAGKLFQLKKSSDGFSTTQDIGLVAGAVDYATILSYCGATSGFGHSTSTVNGCYYWKIYDHTTNHNDMTSVDAAYAQCLTPYAVDVDGHPVFLNGPASDHCHFGNQTPTNAPTGNAAVSLYLVGDDALWGSIESSPFGYSMDFGMLHNFAVATCCSNGSDFDIVIRTNGRFAASPCSTCQTSDFKSIGIDLETDVAEIPYAIADHDQTEANLSPNFETLGSVGKFTAGASYSTSSTDIIFDFNYNLPSAQSFTINWNATNTTSMSGINLGSGPDGNHLAEIRQGYTGDSTGATPSAFYEGAIYASTLNQSQLQSLESNGQTFYSISAPTPCANGGADLLGALGASGGSVDGYGIRQIMPSKPTGTIAIVRADNGAVKILGTTNGSCNPDVSGVSSFCSGSTCHIYDYPNQLLSLAAINTGWQSVRTDTTRYTSGGSASSGPTFTLSAINSLPAITCSGGDVLTSLGGSNTVTRPFTYAAAAKRTATGGALFQDSGSTNLFDDSGAASTLRVRSSSGTQTASAADSSWFAVGGVAPDASHLTAYVNGTGSASGSITTADSSGISWKLCSGWTGQFTEFFFINGTGATGTQMNNLSTAERAVYGF